MVLGPGALVVASAFVFVLVVLLLFVGKWFLGLLGCVVFVVALVQHVLFVLVVFVVLLLVVGVVLVHGVLLGLVLVLGVVRVLGDQGELLRFERLGH